MKQEDTHIQEKIEDVRILKIAKKIKELRIHKGYSSN
jgi:hypothetical protein